MKILTDPKELIGKKIVDVQRVNKPYHYWLAIFLENDECLCIESEPYQYEDNWFSRLSYNPSNSVKLMVGLISIEEHYAIIAERKKKEQERLEKSRKEEYLRLKKEFEPDCGSSI